MSSAEIAQDPKRWLALEPFGQKNRVGFNVHVGLRDFGDKI